jgi:signal transduction histidine kinase/CheY-like chemotaxis protein
MIFAAGILIASGALFAAWRDKKMNELRSSAEAERAALIIENAHQSAMAERELNDFLAHEVRNPLAAATTACSFVSQHVHNAQTLHTEESILTVREDVGVISFSLHYINDLLRDLLDAHKASREQLRIDIKPANLYKDVFEPVSTILYKRDHNFTIEVDCADTLYVLTDRLRLKQIILNLSTNACKFVEKGYIRIGANVVNNSVHLFVEDSGPGIPKDKQETLFEKFQTSLDSLSQGTGVGLSLCKSLTKLLDGDIILDGTFESGVDGCPGSRFDIDLRRPPLHIDDPAFGDADIDNVNNVDVGDSMRELPDTAHALFVDDDVVLRKMFSRAVKRVAPNWRIDEASNGETALRLIDEQSYDMIFVDQYMASIQKQLLGTETTRALRTKGYKGIICGLSANPLEEMFIAAGANAFMSKPFPCEERALKSELCRLLHDGHTSTIVTSHRSPQDDA